MTGVFDKTGLNAGRGHGWLTRLRRDVRGNTMAIMSMAVIPLAGMVGGGFDLARIAIVKTRLQHACDAGALAGRRAMGGGTWAQNDYAPRTAADRFFTANIANNAYGATSITKTYTEAAGKVSGTATAQLSMTLMRIFGATSRSMTVNCDAEMRLPNTDVMFVLDTTGSMDETLSGDSQTKLEGLRVAVKCFYEIVARLNSNAACDGGDPSGGVGDQVQVRFGFVPYATNVNVGKLLPTTYFADRWSYQTRERSSLWGSWEAYFDNIIRSSSSFTNYTNQGAATATANADACSALTPEDEWIPNGNPVSGVEAYEENYAYDPFTQFRADAPYIQRDYRAVYNTNTKTCQVQFRERTGNRRSRFLKRPNNFAGALATPAWRYGRRELNVSGLKNGTTWRDSITMPIGNGFTDRTVDWQGCIEERETVKQASYRPIPAGARDLQINQVPNQGDPASLWAPALSEVVYARKANFSNSSDRSLDEITTFTNYTGQAYACPTESRLLAEWPTASAFDAYVDGIDASGNTYHDIGLIWGARLLSPTGIRRAQNEFTPGGGEIERHMIFMTDGDPCTDVDNYQAYGYGWYDRRQTDAATPPTQGCTTTGTLTQQVNARTDALCEAARNMNVTLWVIWFGASNPGIETRMTACASPGRFFSARNSTQLQQTFRSIADQISALRLTR